MSLGIWGRAWGAQEHVLLGPEEGGMEEGEGEGLDRGERGLLRAVQGVSAERVLGAKGARPVSLPPHCGCFFPGGCPGHCHMWSSRPGLGAPSPPVGQPETSADVARSSLGGGLAAA